MAALGGLRPATCRSRLDPHPIRINGPPRLRLELVSQPVGIDGLVFELHGHPDVSQCFRRDTTRLVLDGLIQARNGYQRIHEGAVERP